MKILQVIFSLSSGGAERFVVDLSNEMSKNNDVAILTLKDDNVDTEKRTFYKFDISDRVKYYNMGLSDGFNISYLWKVYKFIKMYNPDVVHMHLEDVPKYCIIALICLSGKMKFVQTIHNDISLYDNCFYHLYFGLLGRLKKVRFAALSKTNFIDLKSKYAYLNCECIENGRAAIKKTEKFDEVKRELNSYKQKSSNRIFLHIARCSEQKNQKLLIESFNLLCQEEYDVDLFIIGSGYDSELGMQLLSQKSINVHYLGTRKNISDYILNADFFILSSYFEGMPITLIEASLAGVPVVSTPVCGAVDIVKNQKNGILSSDFSKEAFTDAIKTALINYDTLVTGALDVKNSSVFKIERTAKCYINFYSL